MVYLKLHLALIIHKGKMGTLLRYSQLLGCWILSSSGPAQVQLRSSSKLRDLGPGLYTNLTLILNRKVIPVWTSADCRVRPISTATDVVRVSPDVSIGTDTGRPRVAAATCPTEGQTQPKTLNDSPKSGVNTYRHGS